MKIKFTLSMRAARGTSDRAKNYSEKIDTEKMEGESIESIIRKFVKESISMMEKSGIKVDEGTVDLEEFF